jgi:Tol biopolymer transport system component
VASFANPPWSLQTNDIAFLWAYDDHSIFLMDEASTNRRLLFESQELISPSGELRWSPDNKHIAVDVWMTDTSKGCSLSLLSDQGHLVSQTDWSVVSNLRWSPNSQHVAFQGGEKGEERDYVYVMGVDGSVPRRLAETSFENIAMTWSPDSQKIAFVSYSADDCEYALGVSDADGQNLRLYPMVNTDVTGDLFPDPPTWSPDSQYVAYNSPGHENLYVIGINEVTPRCLTEGVWQHLLEQDGEVVTRLIVNPAWQP